MGLGKQGFSVIPLRIPIAQSIQEIKQIYCGPDCSLVLLHDGLVFACGRNNANRLGFGRNVEKIEAFVSEIFVLHFDFILKFQQFSQKKILCLKKKVLDLSISTNHAAFVIAGGYVLTMGDNKEGQLGLGHTKDAVNEPSVVKKITDKFVLVLKIDKKRNLDLKNSFKF